jgi:small-conductance mechanosensitive channel
VLCFCNVSAVQSAETVNENSLNYLQITKSLTDMENRIKNSESTVQDIDNESNTLYELSAQLESAKKDNERDAKSIQKQLDALGAEPEDGLEELDTIASQRKEFKSNLAIIKSRIAEADVLQLKIEELNILILNTRNQQVLGDLFDKQSPLAQPQIFVKSIAAFIGFFWDIVKSPVEWYNNLDDSSKSYVLTYLIPAFFILAGALWLGLILRRLIMKNLGYRQEIENPRYGQKLLAAVSVAIAYGVIPTLIIGGVLLWMIGSKIFTIGLFGIVINSTLYYLLFIIMARAIARVTFAPWNPKWRLVNIDSPRAVSIVKALYLSIVMIGISALLEHIASFSARSDILQNFLAVISCAVKACVIILICTKLFYGGNKTNTAESPTAESESETEEVNLPLKLTFLFSVVTFATFGLALFGYPKLSAFILNRYIVSALLIGIFLILKKLLGELFRRLLLLGFWGKTFHIRRKILTKINFGLTLVLNPILALGFLYVFLNLWGLSGNFILHAAKKLLFGFEIGGVRISLLAIVLGIIVFFGSLSLVKMARNHLTNNVFSKLDMDDGIKHSLSSGVTFVGFIASTLLAIIVMGGDLTSLAVIAGALSVGIGFGLQNITNNLVSGIIILFERPIKIGDWVIINGEEGQIKQINIRSTELETFQKTSVIIPNATLLSSSLTNLTHGNNWTRQSVKVGVAYGTDVQKVTSVLLECAHNNKKILKVPAPYVLFKDFGASSLDFELRCYSNNIWSGWSIPSELRYEINRRFNEEGIEIPFQQVVVHQAAPDVPSQNEK